MTENLIPSGLVTAKQGWFAKRQLRKGIARLTDLPYRFKIFNDLIRVALELLEQSGDEFSLFEDCSCPRG